MTADERKTAAAIQSAVAAKYLAQALEALEANHENHQIHDDHGGYLQSELERKNLRAIHGLRMTIGWLAAETTAQESTTAEKGQPVGSEALLDAVAHLAGAASAYRTYAKRHASLGKVPRDALFTTRAADFEAAALRGHAAVKVALATEVVNPTPAAEPVAEVIEISMLGINSPPGKMIQSLTDIPVGTKLFAGPQPAEPAQPAPQAGAALRYAAGEPPTGAERLAEVRDAIMAYHLALYQRQNGGKAAGLAIYTIEEALGMPWIQGQAAALKKAQGDGNG